MAVLTIAGGGPGGLSFLTAAAEEAIRTSARVMASPRLAKDLQPICGHITPGSPAEIMSALDGEVSDATVVVSGDTGFFSLAKTLCSKLGSRYSIRILPGISSLQMLCARMGTGYEDVEVVSVHGVDRPAVGPASYHRRVFYLTGGADGANLLLEELCHAGLGQAMATVGENLSLADELIHRGTVAELAATPIGPLAVVLVENSNPTRLEGRLRDEDFVRGDVPMTKEAVRVLSVSRLEVQPGDIVYDIGAGTGSVSVALARIAWKGAVYALDQSPEALRLLEENRWKFRAFNVVPIRGTAPAVMAGLPAPDRVFLGGSGGRMGEIVDALMKKSNSFTLCINAITLESVHDAMSLLESNGFTDVEVECVNVSRARAAGHSHMMLAQNPVYIISGRWAK